jgi:uncharacterized membrane protein
MRGRRRPPKSLPVLHHFRMRGMSNPAGIAGLSTNRVEALADGIFAVAMTILVLDLHVPDLAHDAPDLLVENQLVALLPRALAYVSGFIVLGTMWVGHHIHMHFIRRMDRILIWINLLFLLSVTFIPFVVALIGAFGPRKFPCLLYGADLMIAATSLIAQWRYAAGGQRRLARADLSQADYSALLGRVVLGLCGYGLGTALAFVWPAASLCCYAAIALLYLIPGRIDRQVGKPVES